MFAIAFGLQHYWASSAGAKVTTHLLDYFTENHKKGLTTIYYFGDTEIFNKILNCLAQDSLVTRASKLQSIAEHKV